MGHDVHVAIGLGSERDRCQEENETGRHREQAWPGQDERLLM